MDKLTDQNLNHRGIIERHKRLGERCRERLQPSPFSAGEKDRLHESSFQ
jgi:hypothetical protein